MNSQWWLRAVTATMGTTTLMRQVCFYIMLVSWFQYVLGTKSIFSMVTNWCSANKKICTVNFIDNWSRIYHTYCVQVHPIHVRNISFEVLIIVVVLHEIFLLGFCLSYSCLKKHPLSYLPEIWILMHHNFLSVHLMFSSLWTG